MHGLSNAASGYGIGETPSTTLTRDSCPARSNSANKRATVIGNL